MKSQVSNCKLQTPAAAGGAALPIRSSKFGIRNSRAFTLIELLVVISIIGILAALSVPALKNLGKSNVQVSASRQLLDDLAYARQVAVSHHTTVYMVFVPGIWSLPPAYQTAALTNLLDKQFTGYGFLTLRSIGDQPGANTKNYLGKWQSLPDGAFVSSIKYNYATYYSPTAYPINDVVSGNTYWVSAFATNSFPFPAVTNSAFVLPYVAFNYLGQLTQLTASGEVAAAQDEYIPLAQGTVFYPSDAATKRLQFAAPDVSENPPGNSTNSMFNVIRIDHLTGRATQLQQKVQ
jgi:prepilin-type N-terminal cleavage/methylation domain-containing protein